MTGIPFTPGNTIGQLGNAVMQQTFAFRRAVKYAALLPAFRAALADGAWHRGRDLCRQLDTDERTLRGMAHAMRGAVISGNRGYRLTSHATTAEIDHAEARLLSQSREMQDRAREIRLARNRGGEAA